MVEESESKTESKRSTYERYGNYGKYISVHITSKQTDELKVRVKASGKTQNKFLIDSLFDCNSKQDNKYENLARALVRGFIDQGIIINNLTDEQEKLATKIAKEESQHD